MKKLIATPALRDGHATQRRLRERAKADIVAALAAAEGPVASAEIATAIGLGKTRTNELIGELVASGHVVAEGATRSRRYRLEDG